MTWRQRQAFVLLRFSNCPLALKVSTALSQRERVRMLPEVECRDRDVATFTPGKGKKLLRERSHSPEVWPLWGCDGVFYKALVLNLRAQFKWITPPDRHFNVVLYFRIRLNVGLIMAIKKHKILHNKCVVKNTTGIVSFYFMSHMVFWITDL